jgi:hypothetical protein
MRVSSAHAVESMSTIQMKNIEDPRLLWIKGGLFVLLGLIAFALVGFYSSGNLLVMLAAAISIWAFCRAYYFAFYVIEHYIDGRYRFAGLTSLVQYCLTERFAIQTGDDSAEPYLDAPIRKSSRWYAIRGWLILLFAPVVYCLVRGYLFAYVSGARSFWFFSLDLAIAGAWLSLLGFWIVRWRLTRKSHET